MKSRGGSGEALASSPVNSTASPTSDASRLPVRDR